MNNKDRYREYTGKFGNELPVFHAPWWLDAVCGEENWDVCLVEENDNLLGYLPYYKRKKFIFSLLVMPPLTAFLGPNILLQNMQPKNRLRLEKKVYENLVNQLPKFHFFNQSFNHTVKNWLPLYWSGFRQTTRYTYYLPCELTPEKAWDEFEGRVRNDIRKARNKYHLDVVESDDIETFYSINAKVYERNNIEIPYKLSFIKNLDDHCVRNKCRKIYFAINQSGTIYAVVYIIRDNTNTYYLMGGNNPEFIECGGNTLLLWEAIKWSLEEGRNFDFEGSMIAGIEKYYRGFNARQRDYYRVYKSNSFLLQLLVSVKHGY